jgi:TPR repeat protein
MVSSLWPTLCIAPPLTPAWVDQAVHKADSSPPELEAALHWFERAADAGDSKAADNLGNLLAKRGPD